MIPAKRLAEIREDHHEAHLLRAEVAELVTAYEAAREMVLAVNRRDFGEALSNLTKLIFPETPK